MSEKSQLPYPVKIVHDLRIPTRDGIHLAGNLYMPESSSIGRVPALVQYTPYLKDGRGGRGPVESAQRFFASRGYACLTLDMRGFGSSEGVPAPPFSASEASDGVDALAWLADQPWCSGQTGMWGVSYGGDTALAVAAHSPPSLGAIVPIHAIDDEFLGVCYPRGCRGGHVGELDWGFRMIGLQLTPPLRFDAEGRWQEIWRTRLEAFSPCPFTWHNIPPATWDSWRARVSHITTPAYAVSAWHDSYPAETLRYYEQLAGPKRLLLGPWKHEFPDRATHHPIGFWHEMTRWWDQWLKGIDTGILREPALALFDPGAGGWTHEGEWPPKRSAMQEYFLALAGGLSAHGPESSEESYDSYRVDPTVGLNHLPWDWTTPTAATPPDVSADDHRAMEYSTQSLATAVSIVGEPEIIIYLSSDQPDFPIAAWLSDVAPNGYSTLICQGWARASRLAGRPLARNEVCEVRFALNPTAYVVPAGHRLRLCLAGASFPALVPAPVNPVWKVARSPKFPSRLRLPVASQTSAGLGAPTFQPPLDEPLEAMAGGQADYNLSRSLQGDAAAYRFRQSNDYRLEAGVTMRAELEGEARVAQSNPRGFAMQGTQRLRIEGSPAGPIAIEADLLETFDSLKVSAKITVDGKGYFGGEWEQDLRQAELGYGGG